MTLKAYAVALVLCLVGCDTSKDGASGESESDAKSGSSSTTLWVNAYFTKKGGLLVWSYVYENSAFKGALPKKYDSGGEVFSSKEACSKWKKVKQIHAEKYEKRCLPLNELPEAYLKFGKGDIYTE